MNYKIFPPDDLLQARVKLPLSKSMSNRAILINALTAGAEPLKDVAHCDDTDAMLAGIKATDGTVNVGAAGTAMRFLTAYFACAEGRSITIDGSNRMRQRPIGQLVGSLRECGAEIEYLGEEGYPPLKITGHRLHGGDISIDATVSSQFISALMMIAPTMDNGLTINLEGEIASRPYIEMTARMMRDAGVDVTFDNNKIIVKAGIYTPSLQPIEADWSGASFWYEIEALTSGFVTLDGLVKDSCQGDSRVAKIFADLGVDTEWDGEEGGIDLLASPELSPRLVTDMSDTPDLVQPLVVTLSMLGVPFSLIGVKSLQIKETDRLKALSAELLKLGLIINIDTPDTISWEGARRPVSEIPEFDTYDDHRMAMSLAPVAIYLPGIVIKDAEVVSKSYPDFWNHLTEAGFTIEETE